MALTKRIPQPLAAITLDGWTPAAPLFAMWLTRFGLFNGTSPPWDPAEARHIMVTGIQTISILERFIYSNISGTSELSASEIQRISTLATTSVFSSYLIDPGTMGIT